MIHVLIAALYKLFLFVCLLPFFLLYFLLSLCFLSYLFTSLLVFFLTYLSTSSRIDPFPLQAGGRRRLPNLAVIFCGFVLCCNIFCCGCMFAFVVIVSVFQY